MQQQPQMQQRAGNPQTQQLRLTLSLQQQRWE